MGVDRKLLSEFVKITNDDDKSPSPVNVYGTIVSKDGIDYVKIDGSDIYTPFRSTIEVKENERVMLNVQNHRATVTGNLTDPSASGDKVTEVEDELNRWSVKISDNAGRVSKLEITVDGITTTVTGLDGKYTSVKQTVDGLTTKVSGLDGKYTELKQTVDGFDITGMVTFHDLSNPNGYTRIHGGNIETNSLRAETISGGTLNGVVLKVNDGAKISGTSVAGMFVSAAELDMECYHLKIMPDEFYNSGPGLGWTSGLLVTGSGNGSVAKEMWANAFRTRNLSYAAFMDNVGRAVVSPWDVLNSMSVVDTNDGLRIYTPDSQNEYTTHMNPCLSRNVDMGHGLDIESTLATLVNAVKDLKKENQILKEKLGVL